MVDPKTGTPSPFFMRWWQDQVRSNAAIQNLDTPEAVSAALDVLDPAAAQGDILYRGATLWSRLAAGTSGFALLTQGTGADPVWGDISLTIDDLTDVDTSTAAPTDGQTLTWSAADSEWQPATPSAAGALVIDDLTDVDTTTAAPTDGQTLVWSAADSEWQPATPASGGATVIDDLTDVDTSTAAPTDGQTLVWSAADSEWQPATPSAGSPSSEELFAGISYTTTDADFAGNKTFLVSNITGCIITVAPGHANKEALDIIQTEAGRAVLQAGVGVTIQSADGLIATRVQFSWAKLTPSVEISDLYYLRGDLSAGLFSRFIPSGSDRFVLSNGDIYNVAGVLVDNSGVAADELFSNDLGQVIDAAAAEVYISPVGLFFTGSDFTGFEFSDGGLLVVVDGGLLLAANGDTLLTSDGDRLVL
jgi:hypothetical protein